MSDAGKVRDAWAAETAAGGELVRAIAARVRAQIAERLYEDISDLELEGDTDPAALGRIVGMKDAVVIVLASGLYVEVDKP